MRLRPIPFALLFFLAIHLDAQTTQGIISGRLLDSRTGRAIAKASVTYRSESTDTPGVATTGDDGFYYLPLLSPGFYNIRAEAPGYQAQELQDLELAVAARLEIDFRLRPLTDVWESGQYRSVFLPGTQTIVTFYGPDVDSSRSGSFEAQQGKRGTLESAVSAVINPVQIQELPLAGRDVYTMLVALPGVTADTGTSRGLGVSVNGQRPSSSNYLLDGLENNNYLVTGPLTAEAPEAVQEYRISTNNYSAEYGRTAGFVANAVSRAGSSRYHGIGYLYLKNEALNANGFQENLAGVGRLPDKQTELGFQTGGPILRERLFFSAALDHLRSRGAEDPVAFKLPSTSFGLYTTTSSVAAKLLSEFPARVVSNGLSPTGSLTLSPPVAVDRTLAMSRIDYNAPGGKDRITGRISLARTGEPDFIWSPYPQFISPLEDNTTGLALTWQRSITPALTNEAKLGFASDDLSWNRAHPEIPTLLSGDGTTLPGSPAFYSYLNHSDTWELLDNLVRARGRHVTTAGGGILLRSVSGHLTAGRDGQYLFSNIAFFALDRPAFFSAAVDRQTLPNAQLPNYDRDYRYRQFYFFAQDSFRLTSRLTLNYGIRYENYGAPRNVGTTKDALVQLGSGSNFAQRLASSTLAFPNSGDEAIFQSDNADWAPRLGFAYDLTGRGSTLLRGGYGIFFDRPFDNLWQNVRSNNLVLPIFTINGTANYLAPVTSQLATYNGLVGTTNFPSLTLMDPSLRNGYTQSYFLGIQRQFSSNLSLEVNTLGALGRGLISTDVVNREFSTSVGTGRYNEALPDISWRSGQGKSDYNALTALLRYRSSRVTAQVAYTWSHSIDNQSDPLLGDFFDLNYTRLGASSSTNQISAFAQQFNSNADRGNSDFDQRQNLVFLSIVDLPGSSGPRWLRAATTNWHFSQLAAFRSGFPYSIYAASLALPGTGEILNQRANLVSNPAAAPVSVSGGQLLLSTNSFSTPGPGELGSSGRNAFRGPGLYNLDVSFSRSFPIKWLGESGKLVFRMDAYNLLNHANLNNPDSLLSSATFGVASYGRTGRASGFPAVTPLNETARQLQVVLRLSF